MLQNNQAYLFTQQDFYSMFDYFSTLSMKGLSDLFVKGYIIKITTIILAVKKETKKLGFQFFVNYWFVLWKYNYIRMKKNGVL